MDLVVRQTLTSTEAVDPSFPDNQSRFVVLTACSIHLALTCPELILADGVCKVPGVGIGLPSRLMSYFEMGEMVRFLNLKRKYFILNDIFFLKQEVDNACKMYVVCMYDWFTIALSLVYDWLIIGLQLVSLDWKIFILPSFLPSMSCNLS